MIALLEMTTLVFDSLRMFLGDYSNRFSIGLVNQKIQNLILWVYWELRVPSHAIAMPAHEIGQVLEGE